MEIWRECIPNYEVSNLGRVRRSTPGRKTFAGKVMTAKLLKIGYFVVAPTVGGKNKTFYVHDLVTAAFIGPKPEGSHVNHKDGNKQNNAAENLEYVTRAENMRHAATTGLMARGEQHYQSKLTEAEVRSLRADRATGLSFSKLAAKYGISIATAFQIAKGNYWSHIE
jgi:hypothetical protein